MVQVHVSPGNVFVRWFPRLQHVQAGVTNERRGKEDAIFWFSRAQARIYIGWRRRLECIEEAAVLMR